MIQTWAGRSGLLLVVCFVLCGCTSLPRPADMQAEVATYQLPHRPAEGQAMVYVVRPSSFGEKEFGFPVFLDNKDPQSEMGSTMGRQYIYFALSPGDHTILSRAGNWAEATVAAKAGDIIFLQQEPYMGLIDLNNELLALPEYEGKYHVKTLTRGTLTNRQQPTVPTGPTPPRLAHEAPTPREGARSQSGTPRDDARLPLNTVEVQQFTQADGVGASQAFLQYFADGLRDELVSAGVARQVVNAGRTVAGGDTGDTVVLEGKLVRYTSAWHSIAVKSEITLYRRSDHTVIHTITPEVGAKASPFNTDKNVGESTGKKTAYEIKKAMK